MFRIVGSQHVERDTAPRGGGHQRLAAGVPKQASVNHSPKRSKIGTAPPISTLGIRAPGAVVGM